jgi:DNA excision repair protein ERCC-4
MKMIEDQGLRFPTTGAVYVDDRERPSGIGEILRDEFGLSVFEKRLSVGDYWLGGGVIVERKTVDDFALSIVDGRLFRQAQCMKRRGKCAVMIIEGDAAKGAIAGLHPHALKGGLISVTCAWEMPVLYSESPQDTALLLWLMQRQARRWKNEIPIRPGRRPKRLRTRQLFVLQGLPSVGPATAARLLDQFGSVIWLRRARHDGFGE